MTNIQQSFGLPEDEAVEIIQVMLIKNKGLNSPGSSFSDLWSEIPFPFPFNQRKCYSTQPFDEIGCDPHRQHVHDRS